MAIKKWCCFFFTYGFTANFGGNHGFLGDWVGLKMKNRSSEEVGRKLRSRANTGHQGTSPHSKLYNIDQFKISTKVSPSQSTNLCR